MEKLRIGVVGATGLVGGEMLHIIEERAFPVAELRLFASPRSAGKELAALGGSHRVEALAEARLQGLDLVLFSAGSGTSREWAPIAAAAGALVIDNSSAWRMDENVPLGVPEVNLQTCRNPARGIIANPNCSTIQMLVALAPIHRHVPLQRIVVSTYQAISGKGATAQNEFAAQCRGEDTQRVLGGILAGNLLMHWGATENGYQDEELKLVYESRKILGVPDLRVSPTCVRVPVVSGHALSVTVEGDAPIAAADVRRWLEESPGVEVVDDLSAGLYPQPIDCVGKDPIFVGRIRDDIGGDGVQFYCVADNLRKGAALNAVQLAEALLLR